MTKHAKYSNQLKLTFSKPAPTTSGGSAQKSHAKTKRPFAAKTPVHLVLRATQGMPSLRRREREIEKFARQLARDVGVRIHTFANADNHLHLVISAVSREAFRTYLRGLAGTIARIVLNAAKNRKRLPDYVEFWNGRPFTRLASWGKEFRVLLDYAAINRMETAHRLTRGEARDLLRRIRKLEDKLRRYEIAGLELVGIST